MKQFYFAYGSNMNHFQMRVRCPRARIVGVAELPGWGLRERTYADISLDAEDSVAGLLWEITSDCERALDCYEGVANGFYDKLYVNVLLDGEEVLALVYAMTPNAIRDRNPHAFSQSYRRCCLQGAVSNGVPVHPLYAEPQTKRRLETLVDVPAVVEAEEWEEDDEWNDWEDACWDDEEIEVRCT